MKRILLALSMLCVMLITNTAFAKLVDLGNQSWVPTETNQTTHNGFDITPLLLIGIVIFVLSRFPILVTLLQILFSAAIVSVIAWCFTMIFHGVFSWSIFILISIIVLFVFLVFAIFGKEGGGGPPPPPSHGSNGGAYPPWERH